MRLFVTFAAAAVVLAASHANVKSGASIDCFAPALLTTTFGLSGFSRI